MAYHQIDCFQINMKFWKFLGISPKQSSSHYYGYYSKTFIFIFIVVYNVMLTVNFYFLPNQLDIFIQDMLLYFTELAVVSKVVTFLAMRDKIMKILNTLECDIFQPDTENGLKFIYKAKTFIIRFWKIVATASFTSHITHVIFPVIAHLLLHVKLELPVCSYSFLSDEIKERFIYPWYFYQSIGIEFHVFYNLNIDTFFLGLMILTIAQLEVLDDKLRRVTNHRDNTGSEQQKEADLVLQLNKCIIHYDEIAKFCYLIEEVFSVTLFIQFSMASCIICVCLFRFTLPAGWQYYIFLATYLFVIVVQIMVPCWFGTRIAETSVLLSLAVYDCNWTPRNRQFKSNLRLFVERANKPLLITGGKMFQLSLVTFTSIMNSAYSFFTLLRHMQSREV